MRNIQARKELPHLQSDVETGFEINLTPVERVLRRTPLVAVGEYRCTPDHPQFAGGGPEKCPFIVFSHSSVRLLPSRGRPEVCTPNTVNLLDVGDSYERQPVCKEGAICDWIALAPPLLREMAADVDPASLNGIEHTFDHAIGPISPSIFLAQQAFFNSVRHGQNISQLAVEESVIAIAMLAIDSSMKFSRKESLRKLKPRRLALKRQREKIEETKCILAREYWDDVSVAQLADRVHCSPGYLSRSFTALTGFTLHGFQLQLRLREALQLIPEARFNGAGIASQLGFANHSHFSAAFKRQFGMTPKAFAQIASKASLQSLQTLLAVEKYQ